MSSGGVRIALKLESIEPSGGVAQLMALKALVNGKMVHADDLSEDQFRAIQVKKPQVIMFCCQTRGYMRVREEYQEFVHYRRTEQCLGRPDSPVHDLLKIAVRNAARSAGWEADYEVPDPRPEQKWIADVLAQKEKTRVAIEIQISPITEAELTRRQQIYADSKVRSCWFVKQRAAWKYVVTPDKKVPIFQLTEEKDAELGAPRYFVSISPQHKMPIKQATAALLNSEFRWCASRRTRLQDSLVILRVRECIHCREPFGMYTIKTTRSSCGMPLPEGRPQHSLLVDSVTDAVLAFVIENPGLDFQISYPRVCACPRSRIEDMYFTCSHCDGLVGVDRHDWHWTRYSEVIATIALGKPRESLSPEPHWCYSPEGDFCC
jgi:hypothetical protein